MSERADRIIDALRTGHDHLTSLVRGLATADLTRASAAAEWDVSQVLSHLGSGAEIGLATLERALDGTGPQGGDFNKSVWARWDAMSPAERAEGFVPADEALVARYEGLDAQARKDLRIDLGFLPAPVDVATAAGLRLGEFTHHSWDVEVAFDPAASLAPAATGPLLDQAVCSSASSARPTPWAAARPGSRYGPLRRSARSGSTWAMRSRSPRSRPSPTRS